MGSCSLLHGIFLTQGSNPGLLHGRWILYQLSYQWSLRPSMDFYKYYILGWEGWEQNEHIYLHRFTTYHHKFMNQENEPIWIMQIWKWTTIKSSSNNCGLGKNNGGSHGKQFACNAGDSGLISGLGRVRGQGNGNSLQYSGLEYPQTEQPGRLESIAWLTVPQDWVTDTTENKAQPKRQLHLRQKRGTRQKEFSFSQVALSLKVAQSCLTRACLAPLAMGFPRQEYCSG